MTRVLALIGIVALLLFFRIPQRINWDELRGFKGANEVEQAAKPFLDELTPKGENPLPRGDQSKASQDADWMRSGCQTDTIASGARLTQADYHRHRSSHDLNATDPLQNGTLKPFCIHRDASRVFIPDWLIDRQYRLKLTPKGTDIVERIGGQGR